MKLFTTNNIIFRNYNDIKQISIINAKSIKYSLNNTDYFYNENENLFYDNSGNKYNDKITDRFKEEVEQFIRSRKDYYKYDSSYNAQIKLLNNMISLNEIFNFSTTWIIINDLLKYLSDSLINEIIYLYLYKAYHKDNSFEIIEKERIIKVEFYDNSFIEIIPSEDVKDSDNISLLKWFKQNYIIEDITNPFI